jgi:hypothetical protein
MRTLIVASLLLLAHQAQAQTVDQGTLVVRQGGREIGREEFAVQAGRAGGAQGSTIVTRGRFPAVSPVVAQDATVERRTDGSFTSIQVLKEQGRKISRYIAEVTPRNVLRIHASSSGGSEGVREYPAVPNLVGMVDSSYALFLAVADLSSSEGQTITALFPASGRRATFTATRTGGDQGGNSRIVMSGEITGTIYLDPEGRLQRLEFPSLDLEAVRLRR